MKILKQNNSKGITLVALVVTIVVLLILAGISITALFGDNGLIKRAQEMKNTVNEAQKNDISVIEEFHSYIKDAEGRTKSRRSTK